MKEPLIVQVALLVPLRRVFDYIVPEELYRSPLRGKRVKVPFGKQEKIGFVIQESNQSDIALTQLKPLIAVVDEEPLLPEVTLQFIEKTARYYHHPLGEVVFTALPQRIRQGKDLSTFRPPSKNLPSDLRTSSIKNISTSDNTDLSNEQSSTISDPNKINDLPLSPGTHAPKHNEGYLGEGREREVQSLILNDDQQNAINSILEKQSQFQPFLLEGITGSGKTEVYLQVAATLLAAGKQVLVLVPEISLTPQTQSRFVQRFGEQVICFHSDMTPAQRFNTWMRTRMDTPVIVVGTRSALFLPFVQLGGIICDEEHDASFKQQEGFRYSARDSAVLRAQLSHCPVILGSATPSFETLFNAKTNKYAHLILHKRATDTQLPTMHLLDVRHKQLTGGLSAQLLDKIKKHLAQQGQVLLFINRRGFSPTLMCFGCGWMAQCERCDAHLTYHHKKQKVICHHCLHEMRAPNVCPACQSTEINPIGYGTERLESTLQILFPDVTIARIDSDATQKVGSLESLLHQATHNEAQILIGTQMLAKGHHFPHLSLVAIVDADLGLFSVDFRAVERMAQLVIQVAGRAGRVHAAGEVVIQTFHPEHPLLLQILKQDYRALSETLLLERAGSHLPPYSHLAMIRAHATHPTLGETFLSEMQRALKPLSAGTVSVLGPVPAPMLKRQGHYRYQLLLQSSTRQALHALLHQTTTILEKSALGKKVRWSLDVDPIEMM